MRITATPRVRAFCGDGLDAITQVMVNAIEYNTRDGSVVVKLRRIGRDAELGVMDTGVGIPEGDLPRVFETHAPPCLARVHRLVNSVAMRDIAAYRRLAHAHVNDIRIGVGDGDRTDRTCAKDRVVAHRLPVHAAVRCFPNAAARRAVVIDKRLRGNAGDSRGTTAAIRSDAAILKCL